MSTRFLTPICSLIFVLHLSAAPDTVDTTFAASAGQVFDETDFGGISSVLVQPDGKILFGSNEMSAYGDTKQISLIRFNPDGTVDTDFFADNEPNGRGTGIFYTAQGWPEVHSLGLQSDNKIIAAGVMQGMNDGANSFGSQSIVRIHPGGTVDTAFQTSGTAAWPIGGFNYIEDVTVLPDDKIYCVGGFGGIYGPGFTGPTTRYGIARLNADGSLDTGFQVNPAEFGVPAGASGVRGFFGQAAPDASGKVYVVGYFEWGTGFPADGTVKVFARLFPNGSRDHAFSPAIPASVDRMTGVVVEPSGNITALGSIGNPSTDGYMARFTPTGALDGSFTLAAGLGVVDARPLQRDPNGKYLLAKGTDPSAPRDNLIRINGNGSLDPTFDASAAWVSDGTRTPFFSSFTTGADGKIYSGSWFDEVEGVSTVKVAAFEGNATASTLAWSATAPTIAESDGSLLVQVSRLGSATAAASVSFATSPGSADASDFTATSVSLTWAPGEGGPKTVAIPITDDSTNEGNEDFSLTLSAASGAALPGSPSITATIIDDDVAPIILSDPASIFVKEGNPAHFSVTVSSPVPPTYQWREGGVDIPGATSASFSIATAFPADEANYSVVVTTPGGSVTSTDASLTIVPPALVVDATYLPSAGLEPTSLAVLPDGSTLIWDGNFSAGYTFRKVDATGTIDASFAPVFTPFSGFSNINLSIHPLPSGKIFVTGFFEQVNGTSRPQAAILNADGTLDPSFDAGLPNITSLGLVNGSGVTPGGDIYIQFKPNGLAGGIIRLLPDGSTDPTFTTTLGSNVFGSLKALEEMPDGSLLFSHSTGSNFNLTQGTTRLKADGSPYPGFNSTTSLFPQVTAFALLPDGGFAAVRGTILEVYDALGNVEGSYTFTGTLTSVLYHRGRLVVAGATDYNGTALPGLARLSLDGSLDDNFPGGAGPNNTVTGLAVDSNDRLVAIGAFTTWNGVARNRIARFTLPTPELAFTTLATEVSETAGTLTVSVVRYGDTSAAASVRLRSTDGTATSPTNFLAVDEALTWNAGDSDPKQYEITILDAATLDGDLDFNLTLSEATGAVLVPGDHTVTIKDDDSLPTITMQPENTFALDGGSAAFSVSVTSPTTATYQWFLDGTALSGATSDTYSIATISAANEGTYTVVVTNDYDSVTSEGAGLFIIDPPADICAGYTPTLTLSATAWAIATAPDGGAYVGGDFINVNGEVSRDHLVKINADGTLDTSFSPVLDGRVRDILVQDDGMIVVVGNFFNVAGTECWRVARFHPDGMPDTAFNANIGRGSNGELMAVDIQPDGKLIIGGTCSRWQNSSSILGGYRDLLRLNADGTFDAVFVKTSGTATLLDLMILPNGQVLTSHNTTSSSAVKVSRFGTDLIADPAFTYSTGRQKVERIALASDGDYLFAGNQTRKINPDGTTDLDSYATFTRDIREQVNGKIITVSNAINRYLPDGTADPLLPTTSFNSTAYRLDLRDDGKIWVAGAFTSYNGTTASRVVLLNGDPIPLAITSQPESLIQDPGTTAVFSVAAVGTSAISYQWNKDGSPLTDGGPISGATTSTLTVSSITDPDAGAYTCTISNDSGSETSSAAALIVLGIPEFLTQPTGATQPAGSPLTLSAEAVGAGALSYQWLRDGQALTDGGTISGATTDTLSLSPAGVSDSGSYTLEVTNTFGTTPSDPVVVTIDPNPAALADGFLAPAINAPVNIVLPLPGGGALVGGAFSTISDGTTNGNGYLAVVEDDGSVRDLPTLSANGTVRTLAFQADGKIIVGGDFTQVNGTARSSIARLNADLTLDTTFTPGGPVSFGFVYHVSVDENGKIYAGGFFSNGWDSVAGTAYLVRLDATGTVDPSFATTINNTVYRVVPVPGGDIFIAGLFTDTDGSGTTANDQYLARLNNDGTVDTAFTADHAAGFGGDRVLIDGTGRVYANSPYTALFARYLPDGMPDTTFSTTRFNSTVNEFALDSSDLLLAGGLFTTVDGNTHTRIVRLETGDGIDPTFESGTGFNNQVVSIAPASDTSIWVAGSFTEYNGIPATYLARLQGDSTAGDPFTNYLDAAGVPETEQAPDNDYDLDGWANLLEFLYDSNPAVAGGPGVHWNPTNSSPTGTTINATEPGAGLDPTKRYRTVHVRVPVDQKGLTVGLEAGLDLTDFGSGSVQVHPLGSPTPDGPDHEIQVYYLTPALDDEPHMFWRLKVEQ